MNELKAETSSTFKFGTASYLVEMTHDDKGRLLILLTGKRGAEFGLFRCVTLDGTVPWMSSRSDVSDQWHAINLGRVGDPGRTPFSGHHFRVDEEAGTIEPWHTGGIR